MSLSVTMDALVSFRFLVRALSFVAFFIIQFFVLLEPSTLSTQLLRIFVRLGFWRRSHDSLSVQSTRICGRISREMRNQNACRLFLPACYLCRHDAPTIPGKAAQPRAQTTTTTVIPDSRPLFLISLFLFVWYE